MIKYIVNLLVSLDQFINTLIGGDPDETISSRLGKKEPNGLICKLLDKLDKNHCVDSIEADEGADSLFNDDVPPVRHCAHCGKVLKPNDSGFCSDRCFENFRV